MKDSLDFDNRQVRSIMECLPVSHASARVDPNTLTPSIKALDIRLHDLSWGPLRTLSFVRF